MIGAFGACGGFRCTDHIFVLGTCHGTSRVFLDLQDIKREKRSQKRRVGVIIEETRLQEEIREVVIRENRGYKRREKGLYEKRRLQPETKPNK